MRHQPQNDTSPGNGAWLALTLGILLVVYPLSIGPVAKMIDHHLPTWVRVVYAPLGYLHAHSQPVRSFYEWYGKIWGVTL